MKKIVIIFTFFIGSCSSNKLDKTESENLKAEFIEMHKIDQIAAAGKPNGEFINYQKEKWSKFQDSIFSKHKKRVESLFNKFGFLGINELGKSGTYDFWLIVQHSDEFPEFQRKVLKSMKKELKKENANPQNYAYLQDRVNANSGKKQVFGTQVEYTENGQAKAKNGLVDSLNIDKLRKKYNLEPLKKYLNEMTEMHFEMNKVNFNKRGITKPNLYK